jgi:recombination protein RecT
MANQELAHTTDMPLAVKTLREDLGKMSDQFKFALPAHIPVERFVRVVMTAVQRNSKLLRCTRQSFFNACMSAANDGLLPDGREGAIVPYGDDDGGGAKSENAQWLPMIQGLRKKVRNSGVLTDWNVQVVQQGDEFDYALGDNPYIHHKPSPKGGRARPVLFAYSIATYPDGSKSREVMNVDQIEDVRKKSKARKGPWSDPIFYPEMCRKTVARLHSKQLPMSTDLDRLMQRDDALYDFAGAREQRKAVQAAPRPESVVAALDTFGSGIAAPPDENKAPASAAEGERTAADKPTADQEAGGGGAQSTDKPAETRTSQADSAPTTIAHRLGVEARAAGHPRKALPLEYRNSEERAAEAEAWHAGFDGKPLKGLL